MGETGGFYLNAENAIREKKSLRLYNYFYFSHGKEAEVSYTDRLLIFLTEKTMYYGSQTSQRNYMNANRVGVKLNT